MDSSIKDVLNTQITDIVFGFMQVAFALCAFAFAAFLATQIVHSSDWFVVTALVIVPGVAFAVGAWNVFSDVVFSLRLAARAAKVRTGQLHG